MQVPDVTDIFIRQYKSKYRISIEENSDVPKLSLVQLELTEIPPLLLQFHLLKSLSLDYNNITSLPESFCDCMKNLSYLSFHGNSLSTLPNNFGQLKCLTELLLNENSLEKLPKTFVELRELKELQLVGNALQELPSDFGKLKSLKKLTLDENALQFFPDSMGNLENLETLDARYNRLQELSSNFGDLRSLVFLDLSNNKLTKLSPSFGKLPKLQVLDLSFNKLTELPKECCFATTLSKLFLEENELTDVPSWFSNMCGITELSVKNNIVRGTPFSLDFGKALVRLKHFDFSGNYVDSIPDTFGNLCSLEFMDMGSTLEELERRRSLHNGNFLVRLPESFGNLHNLRELHLDENELEELPDSFGNLFNLEFVDLCHNRLRSIPDPFCQLKSLKICQLSINCLTSLPKNFGNLRDLEDLRLDNNMLEDLPETFSQLTKLETLDLFSNRLKVLPIALKHLTRLKRLDLIENDFGIPVLDVPNILVKSQYAPRNPDLVDNWRGKKRADILDLFYNELSSTANENGKVEDCSLERLRKALQSGTSIRRKHGDNAVDELSNNEEEEDEVQNDVDSVDGLHGYSNQQRESDVEIWDNDLVEENPYGWNVNYRSRSLSRAKIDEDMFVPSDIHVPPIATNEYLYAYLPVSDGQFDDAD